LLFEHNETSETYLLNSETYLLNLDNFLGTDNTEKVFKKHSNTIDLHYDLFKKDALIFKDLKSRAVTLNSKTNGDILTMRFKDFPYLGIWAKPHADYVCIEPWIGIADNQNTDQQLITKEGIRALKTGKQFEASYSVEINKAHLV